MHRSPARPTCAGTETNSKETCRGTEPVRGMVLSNAPGRRPGDAGRVETGAGQLAVLSDRPLNAPWPLILRVIHVGIDRIGFHPLTGERHQQRAQILDGSMRIEPDRLGFCVEDHRHSIVNCPHQLIGFRSDDGAAFHNLPLRIVPRFPQAGEGEQFLIARMDEERLLLLGLSFPLVKAGCRDDATPLFECRAKGGLLSNGFGAGIGELVSDLGTFRPRRDQTPFEEN